MFDEGCLFFSLALKSVRVILFTLLYSDSADDYLCFLSAAASSRGSSSHETVSLLDPNQAEYGTFSSCTFDRAMPFIDLVSV